MSTKPKKTKKIKSKEYRPQPIEMIIGLNKIKVKMCFSSTVNRFIAKYNSAKVKPEDLELIAQEVDKLNSKTGHKN